ncbi:MAG: hypothetical protein B6V02_02345 [Thermoprotei archaeon ex4572_64]|nr:MAG: hypothetical protein B6V02_02345 [Thermoprotei archaeon ex4572_64]
MRVTATIVLIVMNVLVFFLIYFYAFSYGNVPEVKKALYHIFITYGASPEILLGEYYRLFTYMFIHADFLHLLMNMYALFVIGSLLERYLRSRSKFLASYITCGLVAGFSPIIHLLLLHDLVLSVGSSGAIFGLVGMVAVTPIRRAILHPMNIIALILINVVGLVAHVDVLGHVLGFITGLVLGALIARERGRKIIIYY